MSMTRVTSTMSAGTNADAGIVNGDPHIPDLGQPPGPGTSLSNAASVSDSNYNTVETKGGRAAFKLDIGDNWTVTPTFMGQTIGHQRVLRLRPGGRRSRVAHFGPENDP